MAMEMTVSKQRHRYDRKSKFTFSMTDYSATPKVWIPHYLYATATGGGIDPTKRYTWFPPNETNENLYADGRNVESWSWTPGADVSHTGTTVTLDVGATPPQMSVGADIASGDCTIEARIQNPGQASIMLQSGTAVAEYWLATAEHCMVLAVGVISIFEAGVYKGLYDFGAGDTAMIELKDGIVRYWRIDAATKRPHLLRSKRSLLTYPVKPVLGFYIDGSELRGAQVWSELVDGVFSIPYVLQIYGVLEQFQDWGNQGGSESLAEKTMTKDKQEDFTYFTRERNLFTDSISVGWDELENWHAFREFWRYHDISRYFIWKDTARNEEYFARFISSFKDAPQGTGMFSMQIDIRQVIDPPPFFM